MIDESRGVVRDVAVDHGIAASPKIILARFFFHLALADLAALVFNDACARSNIGIRKKPASCARLFDAQIVSAWDKSSRNSF